MNFRIGDKVRVGTMRGSVVGVDSTFDHLARTPDMHMVYVRFDNGKVAPYRANVLGRTVQVNHGFEVGAEVQLENHGAVGRITRMMLNNGEILADFETSHGIKYPEVHISNLIGYTPPGATDLEEFLGGSPPDHMTVSHTDLPPALEEAEPLFFGYNQDAPDVSGPPVGTQEIGWDGTTGTSSNEFSLEDVDEMEKRPWLFDELGDRLPQKLADRRMRAAARLAAAIYADGFESVDDMDECVDAVIPFVRDTEKAIGVDIRQEAESRIKADGFVRMYSGRPGMELYFRREDAEPTEEQLADGNVWVEEVFIGRRPAVETTPKRKLPESVLGPLRERAQTFKLFPGFREAVFVAGMATEAGVITDVADSTEETYVVAAPWGPKTHTFEELVPHLNAASTGALIADWLREVMLTKGIEYDGHIPSYDAHLMFAIAVDIFGEPS